MNVIVPVGSRCQSGGPAPGTAVAQEGRAVCDVVLEPRFSLQTQLARWRAGSLVLAQFDPIGTSAGHVVILSPEVPSPPSLKLGDGIIYCMKNRCVTEQGLCGDHCFIMTNRSALRWVCPGNTYLTS